MKNKKVLLIVLGILFLGILAGVLGLGFHAAPAVNHIRQISGLLSPMLEAQNRKMHISVSAEVGGVPLALESDVLLVEEEGVSYLVVEQNGFAVYVADNVLYLENGKAFRLGGQVQSHMASRKDLLPVIGAMFDGPRITAEKQQNGTVYQITVTEEQAQSLLTAVSLEEMQVLKGIRRLDLQLTEENGELGQITFSGNGKVEGKAASLYVTVSGFRILSSGDVSVPEAVKQRAATVNPEELFSLTEDLYRLVQALAPFADMESVQGTLSLAVDCGPIQLDTEMAISDLKTTSGGQIQPEQLQALPEMLGWLCLEGDIRCVPQGDAWLYTLELDRQAMQQLVQMIQPELARYGSDLTAGRVTVLLEKNAVSSMAVAIEGNISAVILQIPISVRAEFVFS